MALQSRCAAYFIRSQPPISSSWVICHSSWVICYSLLHVECHSISTSHLTLIGLFWCFAGVFCFNRGLFCGIDHKDAAAKETRPMAFGVSFGLSLQSQVRESYVTVRESYVTAYCIYGVIRSQLPISMSVVSFQRNVANETWRTR